MSNADTEKAMSGLWDQHLASEFAAKSTDEALATMSEHPHVNMVPLMIGAVGREQLREFYSHHFLSQIPPDVGLIERSLPVRGGETAQQVLTPTLPMNELIQRAKSR